MNSKEFKGDWEILKRKISKDFAELNCESMNLQEDQIEEIVEKQCDPGEDKDEVAKDHQSSELRS